MLGNAIHHHFIGRGPGKFSVSPVAAEFRGHQRVAGLIDTKELAVGQGAHEHDDIPISLVLLGVA